MAALSMAARRIGLMSRMVPTVQGGVMVGGAACCCESTWHYAAAFQE
jgi:hypothetical protein